MINVGVIGYGRAGEAHARCYDAMPQAQIAAVIDPTATRRNAAHIRFPHAEISATLNNLDARIDLALICTPPSSHERYIEQALIRDAHVFCEKPVFLNPDNGVRLSALARRRHRIIYPGHNYLHSPLLQQLRALSTSGIIGALRRLDMRVERSTSASGSTDWTPAWRRDPAISAGGILVDHGPHCVYLAEWLTGTQILHVSAAMEYSAPDIEDHVELVFDMSGEVQAHISLSWRAARRRSLYRLTGTDGTAALDNESLTVDGSTYPQTRRVVETPGSHHAHDDWLPTLAEKVLYHVTSDDTTEEWTRPALVVAHTIACAYASAAQGGLTYRLPQMAD